MTDNITSKYNSYRWDVYFYSFRYINRFPNLHFDESYRWVIFPFCSLSILFFFNSVSIIINEGSTYGLDFIFWTGNDVKEATLTWAAQSLFQNSRQNPLDTTPTRPMTRTIQSRQNSKNEVETTSKIQPVVTDSSLFQNSRQNPLYINQ